MRQKYASVTVNVEETAPAQCRSQHTTHLSERSDRTVVRKSAIGMRDAMLETRGIAACREVPVLNIISRPNLPRRERVPVSKASA